MTDVTRVVLVDGREERRAVMRAMVEHAVGKGTVVGAGGTAAEAAAVLDRSPAEAVVLEIQLPQLTDGLAAVRSLRLAYPSLRIVVCSFSGDLATQQLSAEAGADQYLVKPISSRDLRGALGLARAGAQVDDALAK